MAARYRVQGGNKAGGLHESITDGDYCRYVPTEGTRKLLEDIAHLESQRLALGARTYEPTQGMLVPEKLVSVMTYTILPGLYVK